MIVGIVLAAAVALAQDASRGDLDDPRPAWIASESVDVLAEPGDHAFATMRLPRGARVTVRRRGPQGWLAIEAPSAAFSWIERSAIEELENDRARVTARAAAIRPGREGASLPAGVWTIVRRGTTVRLIDRPPLVIRQDDQRRVWYAIRPPQTELRYIPEDCVEWDDPKNFVDGGGVDDITPFPFDLPPEAPGGRTRLASNVRETIDPRLFTVGPEAPEAELSEPFRRQLQQVETQHRRALQRAIESWQLEPARLNYESLLQQATGERERAAVQLRLDQLERQARLARSARELAALIEQSKSRDAELSRLRERLGQLASGSRASYSAQGLLQTTSTLIDGQRAYVLIGDDGFTTAYIIVPPGLDARKHLGGRVGVRGETRFHPLLKSRVVQVNDLEPLDTAP
jgi:hypothetical protein